MAAQRADHQLGRLPVTAAGGHSQPEADLRSAAKNQLPNAAERAVETAVLCNSTILDEAYPRDGGQERSRRRGKGALDRWCGQPKGIQANRPTKGG